MEHYACIDVSLESASLCVVDATGRIVREAKVASEPNVLIGWFRGLEFRVTRMGLEAGPLSQWLYAGMRDAGLAVELFETRHARDAFKAMPVKTDRKDARGIAQLNAAGLVPVGALQIATGAGSPSTTAGGAGHPAPSPTGAISTWAKPCPTPISWRQR
jgi:transposase